MAALKDVEVPDIGDFSDVPIVEVLVSEGDRVDKDQPLVELESDKASMEVPAPFAGVIKELKVSAGDKVSQGSALAVIEVDEEGDAGDDERDEPEPEVEKSEPEADSEPEPDAREEDDYQGPTDAPDRAPVYASPSVRRLAREKKIDLSTIEGSGRKGRILKEDLEKGATAPAAGEQRTSSPAGEGERQKLTRIQQISARNLTTAWTTIPHVTHHEDADITELEAFRKELNAEQSDVKVTMVALLLKAMAASLDVFGRFASSLDGEELVIKAERHLGFAADTPNGLVVPVVRDVGSKGILQIAGELTELSGAAREGKLAPTQMSGAVFTLSSLGGIGGTGFTPIVNPPQVAILGAVRSKMQPVWDGEAFVPRLILPLSLSYDHRVIDGALAARYCAWLASALADLRRILL